MQRKVSLLSTKLIFRYTKFKVEVYSHFMMARIVQSM